MTKYTFTLEALIEENGAAQDEILRHFYSKVHAALKSESLGETTKAELADYSIKLEG